jgi:hypothetical protein
VGDFDPIQGLWKTEVYELAKWLIGYYYGCGIKKEVDADGARKICDMCEGSRVSVQLLAEVGKEQFYIKQGFKLVPHEYCGPALRKILYKK